MLSKLNPYKWLVGLAIVAAILFGAWAWHTSEVSSAVSAAKGQVIETVAKDISKGNAEVQTKVVTSQKKLQAKVEQSKKDKDEKIQDVNARAESLSDKLYESTFGQSTTDYLGDSQDTEATLRRFRTELLGEIGDDLISEAKRAEVIRLELLSCYDQYEAVEESLSNFNKE
jgi:F0F1-type ATP synthase membrane subunit b/b'